MNNNVYPIRWKNTKNQQPYILSLLSITIGLLISIHFFSHNIIHLQNRKKKK